MATGAGMAEGWWWVEASATIQTHLATLAVWCKCGRISGPNAFDVAAETASNQAHLVILPQLQAVLVGAQPAVGGRHLAVQPGGQLVQHDTAHVEAAREEHECGGGRWR